MLGAGNISAMPVCDALDAIFMRGAAVLIKLSPLHAELLPVISATLAPLIDADLLHMVSATLDPVVVDDDSLGLDAIAEVGPGGHFFGAAHTQSRYRTEHYRPMISDWRNYETWAEDGGPTTPERANRVWKQILAEFEAPPIDPAIDEELRDFVERRKAEGGAPTDF